jgi:hypothetical protein
MRETPHDAALLVGGHGDENAKLISYLLKKLGLNVLDSPDPEDALGVLQETNARVRLAVVDEGGDHETTRSFLNRLHAIDPSVHILLISESDRSRDRGPIPNVRSITKPFRRAQFLGSVLSVMAEPVSRPVHSIDG